MTCTSSGTTSRAGDTRVHTPRSTASRRTIQRRKRFRRLHALPADGCAKKRLHAGVARCRQRAAGRSPGPARRTTRGRARCRATRGRRRRGRTARSMPLRPQHVLQHAQERDDVLAARPAVHERRERPAVARRVEGAHERRRRRAHHAEHGVDRREDARDAAERQAGRDEPGDLAIRRVRIDAHLLDGILQRAAPVVVAVEPRRARPSARPPGISPGGIPDVRNHSGAVPARQASDMRNPGRQNAVTGWPAWQSGHASAG